MRKFALMSMAAASVLALSAGAAGAQTWIDNRYESLSDRIDDAARAGDLAPTDAADLRDDLADTAELGDRYEAGGLSAWETRDLTRRFDQVATRLDDMAAAPIAPVGWYGGQGWLDTGGRWMSVNARQAELNRRIEVGLRNGSLTRAEAARLRADFREVARLEARYRMGGLSAWERGDLDRRFDILAAEIRLEGRDSQYGYGYGRY